MNVRLSCKEAVDAIPVQNGTKNDEYRLTTSHPIVAGLTLGVAIATATAVAELRIKQFWAIRWKSKVVVPCPVMAMPLFLFLCEAFAHARMGLREESPARAIDTAMKTFHEWLAMREGLWLNDKNAVIGLFTVEPIAVELRCEQSLGDKG